MPEVVSNTRKKKIEMKVFVIIEYKKMKTFPEL